MSEEESTESQAALQPRRSLRTSGRIRFPYRFSEFFYGSSSVSSSSFRHLGKRVHVMHRDPHVFLIEDFFSARQLAYFDAVTTLADRKHTFRRSYTENEALTRVRDENRTSSFIYLAKAQDQLVRAVEAFAADFVGLEVEQVEPLQVVSYRPGQEFRVHHDAGTYHEEEGTVELAPPYRFCTFFVYLNDMEEEGKEEEEEGGEKEEKKQRHKRRKEEEKEEDHHQDQQDLNESKLEEQLDRGQTHFPLLPLTVTPKRGWAVLFSNLTPDGQGGDVRTVHQGCPAGDRRKLGVNIWLSDGNFTSLGLGKPKFSMSEIRSCMEGGLVRKKETEET